MWRGLLEMPGLLNNHNLAESMQVYLEKHDYEFKRNITVGAVNVEDGQFVKFNSGEIPAVEFHNAIVASSSMPIIFPTRYFRGGWFMDGGTEFNMNANQGVEVCREMGYEDKDIVLDIPSQDVITRDMPSSLPMPSPISILSPRKKRSTASRIIGWHWGR